MQLYVHREGQQFGPYSIDQVRTYLAAGNVMAEDLGWYEGAAGWAPLSQIEGVVPVAPPEPEPEPVPVAAPVPEPTLVSKDPVAVAAAAAVPINAQQAKTISRSASPEDALRQAYRSVGLRNMGWGGLICVVGTVITAYTYEEAASGPGGGHYVVAWGAIIFGGIKFVRGVIQYCQG